MVSDTLGERIENRNRRAGLHSSSAVVGAILVVAFVLGFSLVLVVFRPETDAVAASVPATVPAVPVEDAEGAASVDTDSGDGTSEDAIADADLPPEVPPGKIPDGVQVQGVRYFKCWDADGQERRDAACGELEVLEKRFSSRLYVVDKCARQFAGDTPEGILSLGGNIDFPKHDISFWAGPSSDLQGARQIGSCVRRGLAGLPLYDMNQKYDKYRVFFTVTFDDPEKLAKKIKKMRRRGRPVKVVKDHVRIRREPLTGFVFGKLGSDTEVTLIRRQDDWCHVITPNDNPGWMICDALEI